MIEMRDRKRNREIVRSIERGVEEHWEKERESNLYHEAPLLGTSP